LGTDRDLVTAIRWFRDADAGSKPPVQPGMQGWPVGVPIGHALLLDA
jgi:hypothetical protein